MSGRRFGVKALWTAFRACRRGAVAVELALLSPIMAMMLIGAIDYGTFIFQKMEVQNASRAGVQYAIQASGNATDTASIAAVVQAASDLPAGTDVSSATFCGCADGSESDTDSLGSCNGDCTGGEFPALSVRVTVTNTYTSLFPYPGIDDSLKIVGVTVMQVP
ncbi:MAG: TadE/TadG family type IV pilus assembly protein [Alphaproteobacteria bacterium]|jgi:Flp pilus assembly protein TadG